MRDFQRQERRRGSKTTGEIVRGRDGESVRIRESDEPMRCRDGERREAERETAPAQPLRRSGKQECMTPKTADAKSESRMAGGEGLREVKR